MIFLPMKSARTLQRYVRTTSTFVTILLRKTGGCSRTAVKHATNAGTYSFNTLCTLTLTKLSRVETAKNLALP